MRIAIISDIHGNLTALDAVLADLRPQKPDVVYQGGDVAFGGAQPAEVIDCIIQEGWKGVLGNTDEMLWDTSARPALEAAVPKLKSLFKVFFESCAPATSAMIGASRLAWLRALPTELRHECMALMHASPGNLWRAPMDTADDAEILKTYEPLNVSIVVYCHIHRPFIRKVGQMTVCNTGSVGSPYDGDPRASYLLIDEGKPAIRRVEYDIEKEVGRLLASDYPYKEWIAEMRRKGSYVPPPEKRG
ncbi:MAG TPA: metallophosphoesterase family protein [Candidatus Angelobacter sp.]|jgi:predicted phosphodiesterase|nr:metallophosphoesterase family protein [Candidatus Angelobacter sp.]